MFQFSRARISIKITMYCNKAGSMQHGYQGLVDLLCLATFQVLDVPPELEGLWQPPETVRKVEEEEKEEREKEERER